jgi:hypothetical protein
MVKQVVSGVGKNASRTDQNVVERTQRVQREATMANATGAPRGSLKTNRELSQGGQMATTASAVSAGYQAPAMDAGPSTQVTGAFAPGNPNTPLTDGAGGNTPGVGPEALNANFISSDPGSVLIRAMYLANPSPELRRMVEAYNEEGVY